MIYSLISNEDYIAALLLLETQEESITNMYNKAYCLYNLNNFNGSLEILKTIVNKVTSLLEMSSYSMNNEMISSISLLKKPLPLLEEVFEINTLYVSIHIKWLYALCLEKCDILDRANLIKEQLKKYNINFGGNNV